MYPESSESRTVRTNAVAEEIITTHCEEHINVLICAHMDILHDIIKHVVPYWPRGYISMGTLLDLNSLEYTIKVHALITYMLMNFRHMYVILYTMNKIISLKENIRIITKSIYNDYVNVRLSTIWRRLDENEGNKRNKD